MNVSVIIPVFHAEDYVRQAVESALAQPETAEVILVEDGSIDDSLAVCQDLATQNPLVQVYCHVEGKNRGPGASRNLGILKSKFEFLAFLDADDFYLPNRFSVAKTLFGSHPEIDGVYEAVALHVGSQAGLERWKVAGRGVSDLVTIRENIPPECLFDALVRGGVGFFHVNGLVVRRSVFDKTGLYDEHLRILPHEDEAMNYRMAAVARLIPGRLNEPVAVYRVHEGNSISAPKSSSQVYKARMMMYAALWNWSRDNLDEQKQRLLLDLFVRRAKGKIRFFSHKECPILASALRSRFQLCLLSLEYPQLLRTKVFWRNFLPKTSAWNKYLL